MGHHPKGRDARWVWLLSCVLSPLVLCGAEVAPAAQQEPLEDDIPARTSLPAGIRVVRDVPYGADARQRFDVYAPARAQGAPVLFLVHGGAWRFGSKSARSVVEGKVARWVPKGLVVISTDYRMLPDADPLMQARDVARAIAAAQDRAAGWGADRDKFVLIGHSAGAHLVALLEADRSLSAGFAAAPWLGVVSLDSGALDVTAIMERRHLPLYDRAFGSDPRYWESASPLRHLTAQAAPFLAVCSTRRPDSCPQAAAFIDRAAALGVRATVLAQDLSHGEINARLGTEPRYTAAVEAFLGRLDPKLAAALAPPR